MRRSFGIIFCGLAFGLGWGPMNAATNDKDPWQEVEQALTDGLPRTALEKVEALLESARAQRRWGEWARAVGYRVMLQAQLQAGDREAMIRLLEVELAQAPEELAPLLETLQANNFWHYFQEHRWRFVQRSATRTTPGKDFTTWDLRRLYDEIGRRFERALAAGDSLRRVPVAQFNGILTPGTVPDRYRPTLYDFVAYQALEFYASEEQAGAQPAIVFELSPTSPIFDPLDQFLAWDPRATGTASDADSPCIKAILLYQELLRFHLSDEASAALAQADYARLGFGHQQATGPGASARYQEGLRTFVERWADDELAALALHDWARVAQQEGDAVRAHALATRGRQIHPDSPGARLCQNLITQLEMPSIGLTTERVWNDPLPPIEVRYRNLTNMSFRLVPQDWAEFLKPRRGRPGPAGDPLQVKELLDRRPVLAWSAALPPTPNFQERVEKVRLPSRLSPGFYVLLASADPGFGAEHNSVSMASFWVSDLALVVRSAPDQLEGFVLHARTGEPLSGAEVHRWHANAQDPWTRAAGVRTDADGFFSLPAHMGSPSLLQARYTLDNALHEITTEPGYWHSSGDGETPPDERTVFFTDRALYRPGQTVFYKGICLELDPARDNYRVLADRKLTVVLEDPNGRELARAEHTANAFGSFHGTFTAPQGGLTGACILRVLESPPGGTSVQVEEYKRPKFRVTLEPPAQAGRLRERLSLAGKAEAYTGAAIDGAPVRYRVVRVIRWPVWWGWSWRPQPPGQEQQEIAHGETRTAVDGSFDLAFVAQPDPQASPEDEPVFDFRVEVEVTDGTGETRTAERVIRVGYTSVRANLTAEEWQTTDRGVELTVRTETHDGEPQRGEGIVRVHRLREPDRVPRASLTPGRPSYRRGGGPPTDQGDLSDPNHWELGAVFLEQGYATGTNGEARLTFRLPSGVYRALLETQDPQGTKVTARLPIRVLNPDAQKLTIPIPNLVAAPRWSVEPGGEFTALWGTGYAEGRAFVEVEHRGRLVQRYWTAPGDTQARIVVPVTEAMRGGFTLHITRVQENRAYLETRSVDVPWTSKNLELSWEHLTSKLGPGQQETWTAIVKKRAGTEPEPGWEPAVAELVATLYDASLDAYRMHAWPPALAGFRQESPRRFSSFANALNPLQPVLGAWRYDYLSVELTYRDFLPFLAGPGAGSEFWGSPRPRRKGLVLGREMRLMGGGRGGPVLLSAAPAPLEAGRGQATAMMAEPVAYGLVADAAVAGANDAGPQAAGSAPDLDHVVARQNLQETAAFFPQLVSDSNGVVRMTFTMPEALTTWRFLGFAHDQQLRSGSLAATAITAKDLMVQPNPPRFLREGDVLEFTAKVSNASDVTQTGRIRLSLNDAASQEPADARLGNADAEQGFEIPARESRSLAWRLRVPDGTGFLIYKVVAATATVADGEEGHLPVLSRRILLTESLPLPVRGPGHRQFRLEKLLRAGESETLRHQGLTVQMASNPAWYAVLALPYLMEYPHDCTEQTFNRFYANSLARFIALSDPRIRKVFDQWRDTPVLDSPLEQNPELKAVLIEETPWLRQARAESQARRDVGLLFEEQRLGNETDRAFRKLAEAQMENGAWPWFPGGPANEYITRYIATGFGRLRHLGLDVDVQLALQAWEGLDQALAEEHRLIQESPKPEEHVPGPQTALHLYGRSFFLKDRPIAAEHEPAYQFFLKQARRHWLKAGHRQAQGHLALALTRWGGDDNVAAARAILRSLLEYSVANEELGRFWPDAEASWWWHRAPIETQALLIEAFDEITADRATVEELKVWLLKQKQTQDWKTTKATADAVYALLLRGQNLLATRTLVEVEVGRIRITPVDAAGAEKPGGPASSPAEAVPGLGFFERRFPAAEVRPELGEVSVRKTDEGVAWGAVHWQYLEDLSRVTAHSATPLRLEKALYTRRNTERGPVLQQVDGPIAVGDELVTRLVLRVDRDMEYLHLKDQRGSGTEPVNVLSGYRYQDGLGYYESTRDTASHFFIDYLPRGTYVFEYSTRVQHRGEYASGVAEIQCLYAPEFNSHSASVTLRAD